MVYESWKVSSSKGKELYDKIYENSSVLYMNNNIYADMMVTLDNAFDSKQITKEEYESLRRVVYNCCDENQMNIDANPPSYNKALEDAKNRWKNKNAFYKFVHRKQRPSVKLQKLSEEQLNKLYR